MENVIYIFPACYGIRQNERKYEILVLPFLLSVRVRSIVRFPCFYLRKYYKQQNYNSQCYAVVTKE